MSDPLPDAKMKQPEHTPSSKPPSTRWQRISLAIQLALSFAVAGGVFFYLLLAGGKADDGDDKRPTPPEPVVTEVIRPNQPPALRIKPDTLIFAKLAFEKVRRSKDLTGPGALRGRGLLLPGNRFRKHLREPEVQHLHHAPVAQADVGRL